VVFFHHLFSKFLLNRMIYSRRFFLVVVPIFFLRFRYYMLAFFFPCFESIITFNYYLDNQLKIFWYIGWRFRFLLVFDANELCALEH
jgi:hypothetical protein